MMTKTLSPAERRFQPRRWQMRWKVLFFLPWAISVNFKTTFHWRLLADICPNSLICRWTAQIQIDGTRRGGTIKRGSAPLLLHQPQKLRRKMLKKGMSAPNLTHSLPFSPHHVERRKDKTLPITTWPCPAAILRQGDEEIFFSCPVVSSDPSH